MSDERVPASRVPTNVPEELGVTVRCPVCGAERRLWFNGGELDAWTHCGHRFALEHGTIWLAHYPPQPATGTTLAPHGPDALDSREHR